MHQQQQRLLEDDADADEGSMHQSSSDRQLEMLRVKKKRLSFSFLGSHSPLSPSSPSQDRVGRKKETKNPNSRHEHEFHGLIMRFLFN